MSMDMTRCRDCDGSAFSVPGPAVLSRVCVSIVFLLTPSAKGFHGYSGYDKSSPEVLELSGTGSWRLLPAANYEFGHV